MAKARSFGIGMDYSATSKSALKWTIDNLVEEADRIILIHVASAKSDPTNKQLFQNTGSRKHTLLIRLEFNFPHFILKRSNFNFKSLTFFVILLISIFLLCFKFDDDQFV